MEFSHYAPSFATPYGEMNESVVSALAEGYLAAAHRQVERALDAATVRDPEAFRVTSRAHPSTRAWRPETGQALEALRHCPRAAALQLGLAYAALGRDASVQMRLARRARLFFEGHLFEVTGDTELHAADNAVVIETSADQRIVFRRLSETWCWDRDASANALFNWLPIREPTPKYAGYVVHTRRNMTDDGFDWPHHDEAAEAVSQADSPDALAIAHGVRAAQQCVHEFAPGCRRWIERMCVGFAVSDVADINQRHSASLMGCPGLICVGGNLSANESAIVGGELLVHESAHQYLLLYCLAVPLTNDQDPKFYYSPLKRAHRNVDRLLLAAHATASMLLYYAEAQRNGAGLDRFLDVVRFHIDTFAQMRIPLSTSPGLTLAGRSFFNEMTSVVDRQDLAWAI